MLHPFSLNNGESRVSCRSRPTSSTLISDRFPPQPRKPNEKIILHCRNRICDMDHFEARQGNLLILVEVAVEGLLKCIQVMTNNERGPEVEKLVLSTWETTKDHLKLCKDIPVEEC